jgi:hypothetical protein
MPAQLLLLLLLTCTLLQTIHAFCAVLHTVLLLLLQSFNHGASR